MARTATKTTKKTRSRVARPHFAIRAIRNANPKGFREKTSVFSRIFSL